MMRNAKRKGGWYRDGFQQGDGQAGACTPIQAGGVADEGSSSDISFRRGYEYVLVLRRDTYRSSVYFPYEMRCSVALNLPAETNSFRACTRSSKQDMRQQQELVALPRVE